MIITLTNNNYTISLYDTNNPSDCSHIKRRITIAIKHENHALLKDAKLQLQSAKAQGSTLAESELKRIQSYLDKQKIKNEYQPKELITDKYLYPRCEYYTQFEHMTAYDMHESTYWGSYHRSESCRHFTIVHGRKNAQFNDQLTLKKSDTHSYHAHTGSYHSIFHNKGYKEAFPLQNETKESSTNIRDHLLLYKNSMAALVVESFSDFMQKQQKTNTQSMKNQAIRPIVYYEYNYPCVLVSLPAINYHEKKTAAAKYWKDHPKVFQVLLLTSFIAILNHKAKEKNIPIETVIRSSFGHALPSVCETGNSFRINIGLIPACYAKLMGEALYDLHQLIDKITDDNALPAAPKRSQILDAQKYNASKLKHAIKSKPIYRHLTGDCDSPQAKALRDKYNVKKSDFKNISKDEHAFTRLFKAFKQINKDRTERTGHANFSKVEMKNTSIWQLIRSAGNSMGKSILSECFRRRGTPEWFVKQIMMNLENKVQNPVQVALQKLVGLLEYNSVATINEPVIQRSLKKKQQFSSLSFKKIYQEDEHFANIIKLTFESFNEERPDFAIHSELERSAVNFYKRACVNLTQEEDSFGSDSEFEEDLTDDESTDTNPVSNHYAHKKLRVASGMKAILAAQHAAIHQLYKKGIYQKNNKNRIEDCEHMYYEVADALKLIKSDERKLNEAIEKSKKISDQAKIKNHRHILHFDLNHCNAANNASPYSLQQKIIKLQPSIIILDYTSTTGKELRTRIKSCLSHPCVDIVFCVNSGLKNGQCADLFTYGTINIGTREKKQTREIYEHLEKTLGEENKLTHTAHEKTRAAKAVGHELSHSRLMSKKHKNAFVEIDETTYTNSL